MNKKSVRREEGQSMVIIALLLVVLLVLVGLVIDAGNAYAQRRIVQNAVDSAALAGVQELARQDDWELDPSDSSLRLYNYQVINAVEAFAKRNGVAGQDLAIYYADIDGNVLADAKFDLGTGTLINEYTFGGPRAESILVEGDLPFPTYLVRLLGRDEMMASAQTKAILACGACTAGDPQSGGLFPIAVYTGLFDDTNGNPEMGRQYRIFEKSSHFPGTGSFGWLSWNQQGGHTSNRTLIANMQDTSRSGQWSVGDFIPTSTGLMSSRGVRRELGYRIDNRTDLTPPRLREVTLPIFDYTQGNGQNKEFHIVGFGRFEIDCYHFSKTKKAGSCAFDKHDKSKWIAGTFKQWVEPNGQAGCTNYGVCTTKIPEDLPLERALRGKVVAWQVRPREEQLCEAGATAVDVVHVMDISGSMCSRWNGSSHRRPPCTDGERIQTAKDVVTQFNDGLGWNANNQVGLATYPTIQNSYWYYTDCGVALGSKCRSGSSSDCSKGPHNKLYFATKDVDLTTDRAYVNNAIYNLTANGGTSMPKGLQYGYEMVNDPAHHKPDNLQVIILTTDGMANIKLDGEWSGYMGNYPNPYWIETSGCNDPVYQGAIQQANEAKQNGVIIFTIGIHDQIDEPLMEAIASPTTAGGQPHFFKATQEWQFAEIYQQIEGRLPTLCSNECAEEDGSFSASATVELYDDRGRLVATTTADASGEFYFGGLESGTYTLKAYWTDPTFGLKYDLMTWTLGGEPATTPIEVEIPLGKQTTEKDLYLRTSEQINCK